MTAARFGLSVRLAFAMTLLTLVCGLLPVGAEATYAGRVGRIAFTDYTTGQIYAINPDGSALRQLTHGGPGSFAETGSWAPHGRRLIFSFSPTPDTPARIWAMDAEGGNQHRLTNDTNGYRDLDPS